jgi:hypothetical protein
MVFGSGTILVVAVALMKLGRKFKLHHIRQSSQPYAEKAQPFKQGGF